MKRLLVRPLASRELLTVFQWYEKERAGLGGDFLAAVDEALELTRSLPSSGRPLGRRTRRLLLRRFPFLVLYVIEPDRIVVTGVLHTHREPRRWADRVQERPGHREHSVLAVLES